MYVMLNQNRFRKYCLWSIIILLSFGCGSEDESVEEEPRIIVCMVDPSFQLFFLSITDQEGDNIFSNPDYNPDSVQIKYFEENMGEYLTYEQEMTLIFENEGRTIIGFPFTVAGISSDYLFDYKNGDVDTLSLGNHKAFLPRQYQLTSRIVDFYFNGNLFATWDIERDIEFMVRFNRENTTSIYPFQAEEFDDPVIVNFIK